MTRRTELEPMSTTPMEWPTSSRPCAGMIARERGFFFRRIFFGEPVPTSPENALAALAARKAAGRRLFERFATARQTRICHEIFMGVERLFARRGLDTHRGAIGQEVPALLVVLEIRQHDL